MNVNRFWRIASLIVLMAMLVSSIGVNGDALAASPATQLQTGKFLDHILGPFVSETVTPHVSAAIRDLPVSVEPGSPSMVVPRQNPLRN